MVLGSTAIANLRGKQSVLFKVNESGTEQLLREGVLGRLEGFNIHSSAGVKRAPKVAATGYLVNGEKKKAMFLFPLILVRGVFLQVRLLRSLVIRISMLWQQRPAI